MLFNGTAKLTHFDRYINLFSSLSVDEAQEMFDTDVRPWVKSILPHERAQYRPDSVSEEEANACERILAAAYSMLIVRSWSSYPPESTREAKWPKQQEETVRRMRNLQMFHEEFDQPVRVSAWVEGKYALIYIGNAEKSVFVYEPEKYLEYVPDKDYSELTPVQVRTMLGTTDAAMGNNPLPEVARNTLTVSTLKESLQAQDSELDALKKHIDEAGRCESPELIEMKREIERLQQEMWQKKDALMEQLETMKYEMEEKKFQLESQIFLLDAQIYTILCYTGEAVKFGCIRSGKNAPDTEPIVIHQKLRFLDEEMGRLASIYYIEWGEIDMFEGFLKHSPYALDVFAPNERCITLVRLSRTGKQTHKDSDFPYDNLLDDYQYFHGGTIGIIIRNGENLYLGWTEEARVNIKDDLIISKGSLTTEFEPYTEKKFTFKSEKEEYIRKQRMEKKDVIDGIISRNYVYNVLQGIVDNTPMLPLPDGVKLNKQSEYVIYSVADKWLTDNKYGSWDDIAEKCNATVKEGDPLLTIMNIRPEPLTDYNGRECSNQKYHNARGKGDCNRTHDCRVSDCTIYPANLVEFDTSYFTAVYEKGGCRYREAPYYKCHTREEIAEHMGCNCPSVAEYDIEEQGGERHVYVSCEKSGEDRPYWLPEPETKARANVELYDGEFINLAYLDSVRLTWVINNRKLGGWCIAGHAVDYAYAIRYLKHALEYIRKREEAEKAVIDAIDPAVCMDPEWPLRMVEFKLAKGVRNVTPRQASRFAKWMQGEA